METGKKRGREGERERQREVGKYLSRKVRKAIFHFILYSSIKHKEGKHGGS